MLFDVIYQNRNLMKRQTTVNASVITKFFAWSHKAINYTGFSHQLYHQTFELIKSEDMLLVLLLQPVQGITARHHQGTNLNPADLTYVFSSLQCLYSGSLPLFPSYLEPTIALPQVNPAKPENNTTASCNISPIASEICSSQLIFHINCLKAAASTQWKTYCPFTINACKNGIIT